MVELLRGLTASSQLPCAPQPQPRVDVMEPEPSANEPEPAQAEPCTAVPKETVEAGMKGFEDMYNAGKFEECGKCYSPECFVTVNGGAEKGGFGPFKTQAEVGEFLKTLSGSFGGTNMVFTVTKVDGMVHEDTWTADSGTGACKATWARIDNNWMITKDEISFAPNAAPESE